MLKLDFVKDIFATTGKLIGKSKTYLIPRARKYCLGKKAGTTLLDNQGKPIIKKGEIVEKEHIEKAESMGKLHELALGAGFGVAEESWEILLKEAKGEEKLKMTLEKVPGKVELSNTVLANLAAESISEISGIVGLYGGKQTKGIKISQAEGHVSFDLHLILSYGADFSKVAELVKNKVKKDIEAITSYKVNKVNVFIDSVKITDTT